jgi:hypothetical protein
LSPKPFLGQGCVAVVPFIIGRGAQTGRGGGLEDVKAGQKNGIWRDEKARKTVRLIRRKQVAVLAVLV